MENLKGAEIAEVTMGAPGDGGLGPWSATIKLTDGRTVTFQAYGANDGYADLEVEVSQPH